MNEEFKFICRNSETYGAVLPEKIEIAEKELEVSFPQEYKNFLLEFGALLGDGFEIYGLPLSHKDDIPVWQDVVDVTRQSRMCHQIGSENPKMILISSDGMETNYFLNTESVDTEIWEIGYDNKKIVAHSLYDLVNILKNK